MSPSSPAPASQGPRPDPQLLVSLAAPWHAATSLGASQGRLLPCSRAPCSSRCKETRGWTAGRAVLRARCRRGQAPARGSCPQCCPAAGTPARDSPLRSPPGRASATSPRAAASPHSPRRSAPQPAPTRPSRCMAAAAAARFPGRPRWAGSWAEPEPERTAGRTGLRSPPRPAAGTPLVCRTTELRGCKAPGRERGDTAGKAPRGEGGMGGKAPGGEGGPPYRLGLLPGLAQTCHVSLDKVQSLTGL